MAAGALLVCCTASCGPETGDTPESAEDQLVVFHRGNGAEPGTLDPHLSEDALASNVLVDLYEGLVARDRYGKIVPGTAESWTLSPDGREYVFRLRPDARWSNGDPVTAGNYVDGLRRVLNPQTASPNGQFLLNIVNAREVVTGEKPVESLGVRALDDHTLRLELTAPTPYMLDNLAGRQTFPLHGPSYELHGRNFVRPGVMVSNGPYRLVSWAVQSHVEVERNPFYWGAADVEIDRVVFHSTEDGQSEVKRYRAGELDYTYDLPDNLLGWAHEEAADDLRIAPVIANNYLAIDVTEPPLDDVRIRKALNLAVDREILAERVLGGDYIPAYSFVPHYVNNYDGVDYAWRELSQAERNRQALELLGQAGYGPDNPLKLTIHYNTNGRHRKVMVAVAAMWKAAIGIDIEILNLEFKVLLDLRHSKSEWQIMRQGWFGMNDPYSFLELFLSETRYGATGFSDPAFDRRMYEASQTADLDMRKRLLAEAEVALLDTYPVVPLYFNVRRRLVNPAVRGYEANIVDVDRSHLYHIDRQPAGAGFSAN
jgi:oligopeptide transport system substrate-binding protein